MKSDRKRELLLVHNCVHGGTTSLAVSGYWVAYREVSVLMDNMRLVSIHRPCTCYPRDSFGCCCSRAEAPEFDENGEYALVSKEDAEALLALRTLLKKEIETLREHDARMRIQDDEDDQYLDSSWVYDMYRADDALGRVVPWEEILRVLS